MSILDKVRSYISSYSQFIHRFVISPLPYKLNNFEKNCKCDFCSTEGSCRSILYNIENSEDNKNACERCMQVINLDNCLNAIYESLQGNSKKLENIFEHFSKLNKLSYSEASQYLNELISASFSMRLLLTDYFNKNK